MFVKHPLGLQAPSIIFLAGFVLLIPRLFCASATCPPPDFPEGGSYKPEKADYEVGSRVYYSCKDRLTRFGTDRRTCQSSGWSGKTPFCDSPSKIKNPIASSGVETRVFTVLNGVRASEAPPRRQEWVSATSVSDGSLNTCFRTKNSTYQFLQVFLDRPAAVYAVRIFLPKGKNKFKIVLHQPKTTIGHRLPSDTGNCQTYDGEMAEKDWVIFLCEESKVKTERDVKVESITVQVNSGTASDIHLCEIEVYTKDDEWCQYPTEYYIPNGQLEVSRNKEILNCHEGFKEKDNRRVYATCENNKWSYLSLQCIEILCESSIGNVSLSDGDWHIEGKTNKLSAGTKLSLKCKSGFHPDGKPLTVTCHKTGNWTRTTATCKKDKPQKDYKIIAIAVGTVVVLIIFILLGLTIFLIQRKKGREVVVIYKPGENNSYSTPPSVGGHSIAGLSEAEYSTVYYEAIQNSQNDPRSPPPKPPSLAPRLERGYSKPVDDRSLYANTNPLPTDLAFGTLTKTSSLYNTMN